MSRTRFLGAELGLAVIVVIGLAGCTGAPASSTQTTAVADASPTQTLTPTPEPEQAIPVELSLGETAESVGCGGYAQSSELAPYVTEWGKCTFQGGNVRAYHFASAEDYASFLDAVSGFGIVEGQLAVSGPFVFAPDDQTQLDALRSVLPAQ